MSGRSRRRAGMSLRLLKQTCRCRNVLSLDTAALYTVITGRLGSFRSGCINLDNERSLAVGRIYCTTFASLSLCSLSAHYYGCSSAVEIHYFRL